MKAPLLWASVQTWHYFTHLYVEIEQSIVTASNNTFLSLEYVSKKREEAQGPPFCGTERVSS